MNIFIHRNSSIYSNTDVVHYLEYYTCALVNCDTLDIANKLHWIRQRETVQQQQGVFKSNIETYKKQMSEARQMAELAGDKRE